MEDYRRLMEEASKRAEEAKRQRIEVEKARQEQKLKVKCKIHRSYEMISF